jgi:hypothetical protein
MIPLGSQQENCTRSESARASPRQSMDLRKLEDDLLSREQMKWKFRHRVFRRAPMRSLSLKDCKIPDYGWITGDPEVGRRELREPVGPEVGFGEVLPHR